MREDARYSAAEAPRVRPLLYPGERPRASVLVTADALWEIRDRDGAALGSGSSRSEAERLGACRVALDEPAMRALGLSTRTAPHLNSVLEESFGVAMDARIPVLAIGSNASPAQLRHKFAQDPGALLIPQIRARIHGARAGFCAFLSSLGYVPATIYPEAGAVSEMVVQFLDMSQLRDIDATEAPGYRRVWLEGIGIELETGERLPGAYAYVAERGFLRGAAGPLVMGTPGEEPPEDLAPERWVASQEELLQRLSEHDAFRRILAEERRAEVFEASAAALVEAGAVETHNEFFALPDDVRPAPRRYGELLPERPCEILDGAVRAIVAPTPDLLARRGRSVVRLGAQADRALGFPSHVEIVSTALRERVDGMAPQVVATVYRETAEGVPPADPARIEIDQMLRMGLGVERGDLVEVRPVAVRRARGFDLLLGAPNYLSMRVTMSDPSSQERDVCLMSALSLQLLGVGNGEHVVLEGLADEQGDVPMVVLKAFETPQYVWDERERMTGGVWDGRFPGARETLGVHPDIPTVFLDSATRSRLNLGERRLGVVRARPARLQQFGNELREMLLLLAVAFIGIVGLVGSEIFGGVLLGILVVGAFALVLVKLRRRLSHRSLERRGKPRRVRGRP